MLVLKHNGLGTRKFGKNGLMLYYFVDTKHLAPFISKNLSILKLLNGVNKNNYICKFNMLSNSTEKIVQDHIIRVT